MNARSRLVIGACILALGAGTLWVAATQSQDDVRYVQDLLARPADHREGTFTLMGIPEPEEVPVMRADGGTMLANPLFTNETRDTVAWTKDGVVQYSTRILRTEPQADGTLRWSFRNETRLLPADPAPVSVSQSEWNFGRAAEAFPVVGFSPDGRVHPDTPRVWAVYGKAPEHPMQPKPSQFTGRLLSTLPDGTAIPEGALIYEVTQFTAGCSSKFLPPAYADYQ